MVFILGCTCICANQKKIKEFSNSFFILFLMPTWLENMVPGLPRASLHDSLLF